MLPLPSMPLLPPLLRFAACCRSSGWGHSYLGENPSAKPACASPQGQGFDCYAKQWRLAADVMNDVGEQQACVLAIPAEALCVVQSEVHSLLGPCSPYLLAAGLFCW